MSGFLGDLSEKQQAVLDQFRDAVSDIRKPTHTDAFLLKWLRARDFNLSKAEQMFRQSMKWRAENGVDSILEDYKPPEVMLKFAPGGFLDCSAKGCPLFLTPIGGVDFKSFLEVVPQSEFVRFGIYILEYAERLKEIKSRTMKRTVETGYVVVDFENCTLRHLYSFQVLNLMTTLFRIFDNNYPETLEKAFVINAPGFFPVVWKLLSPILNQRTTDKIHIFGKGGGIESMLKYLEPEGLPKHWGGHMLGDDGDPRCPEKVNPGGELPKNTPSPKHLSTDDNAITRVIGRRDRWELPVTVDVANQILSWAFQTAYGDVAFGVRYLPPGDQPGEPEQLVELQRVPSCALFVQTGCLHCVRRGIYVLEFDNTFSWMTSKTLSYTINLEQCANEP